MTHQRKLATPSTLTKIHTLDANDLRHVRGGVAEDGAVSNILKTRHDTVKNTIGNIR